MSQRLESVLLASVWISSLEHRVGMTLVNKLSNKITLNVTVNVFFKKG